MRRGGRVRRVVAGKDLSISIAKRALSPHKDHDDHDDHDSDDGHDNHDDHDSHHPGHDDHDRPRRR